MVATLGLGLGLGALERLVRAPHRSRLGRKDEACVVLGQGY